MCIRYGTMKTLRTHKSLKYCQIPFAAYSILYGTIPSVYLEDISNIRRCFLFANYTIYFVFKTAITISCRKFARYINSGSKSHFTACIRRSKIVFGIYLREVLCYDIYFDICYSKIYNVIILLNGALRCNL